MNYNYDLSVCRVVILQNNRIYVYICIRVEYIAVVMLLLTADIITNRNDRIKIIYKNILHSDTQ